MNSSATNHELGFQELDEIIKRADRYGNESFHDTLAERRQRRYEHIESDDALMRNLASVIAYSQGAKSRPVAKLLEQTSHFDDAFANFNVEALSVRNPCDIIDANWSRIASIRQKTKAFQIITAARAIKRSKGEILKRLSPDTLPIELQTERDIAVFWRGFDELKNTLSRFEVPFISETTSLLHFILHLGGDCVKPDSAVQRAAGTSLRWSGGKSKGLNDKQLRQLVEQAQKYALSRGIRAGVVDLYLLIEGKQTWASDLVSSDYYSGRPEIGAVH